MPLTREVLEKYKSEAFIETGLGDGGGVCVADAVGFNPIYSIELDFDQVSKAGRLPFSAHVLTGDSAKMLRMLLGSQWGFRTTFWLDAHPCINPMRLDQCPLLAELDAIGGCDMPAPFILIDDMRVFSAPDRMRIEESLRAVMWIKNVVYEDSPCGRGDIMVGTP